MIQTTRYKDCLKVNLNNVQTPSEIAVSRLDNRSVLGATHVLKELVVFKKHVSYRPTEDLDTRAQQGLIRHGLGAEAPPPNKLIL